VNGPVYDLVTTLSKFLLLGLSVEDVIAMATARPAAAIGRSGELGAIAVGRIADLSILRLAEGRFPFRDAFGDERVGDRRLEPVATIRAGETSEPSPWRGGPA
jgi:dihydroorotase